MILRRAARPPLCLTLSAFLLLVSCATASKRPPTARPRPGNPTLVLDTPRGERTLPAVDLTFVSFERVYRTRGAPRTEAPGGSRVDVEDRRRECRCVRLQDWSRYKFSKLRQIEFTYPPDERVARLRLTRFDGKLIELRADALFGAFDSFAPRVTALVDGEVREFLLILPPDGSWPEEKLARILLKRPPPSRRRR